jgi:hypothetical protein
VDLVASGVPAAESRIERIFEWAHARRIELVKWLLAVSGALFVPVAIAVARGEVRTESPTWWLVSALAAAVALASAGLGMLFWTARTHQTYLATQALLGELQKIAPFIRRYRDEIERRWP